MPPASKPIKRPTQSFLGRVSYLKRLEKIDVNIGFKVVTSTPPVPAKPI